MLSDLSAARADAVRVLIVAHVPVIGIPLTPYEDGYCLRVAYGVR
jgi:hypothetical protein